MKVNVGPDPAAVFGVNVTGPAGTSGAIEISALRVAPGGPQTWTDTPGTPDVTVNALSRCCPSSVIWNFENRLPKLGVTLVTVGGFGFSGNGSAVGLPLVVSMSCKTPSNRPTANCLPSGRRARPSTVSGCAWNTKFSTNFAVSHFLTIFPSPTE